LLQALSHIVSLPLSLPTPALPDSSAKHRVWMARALGAWWWGGKEVLTVGKTDKPGSPLKDPEGLNWAA
jgi:hypothetical protein